MSIPEDDNQNFLNRLSETYPFLTICSYAQQEYVGIVQNRDSTVTTIYDYGAIQDPELKAKFLELGDIWWGESNRLTGPHIFLRKEWVIFRPYIKTFSNKSLVIILGPTPSLSEYAKTRSKRRSITLVRRI